MSRSASRDMPLARKARESGTVTSLVLEPTDGQELARPLAGQFVVLRLGGASGSNLLRSYSLSGSPGDLSYRISVKREGQGAASNYINDKLQVGDVEPHGHPSVFPNPGFGPSPIVKDTAWVYPREDRKHGVADLPDRLREYGPPIG